MWGLTAPLPAEHDHHGIVLILAFYTEPLPGALFISDDGQLHSDALAHLRTEWRFNWSTHTWEDLSETGALNDESSDGSPEISGDFPEPPRDDRGDSGDEGDGTLGDVDTQ